MKVDVYRTWETERSIISRMCVDGTQECFGLEPSRTTPVHEGHPCIPAGTYNVVLTMSPHLGYVTPEVLDVPGRTSIRWHIGNKPEDVLGCIAVGLAHSVDWVAQSKTAFNDVLMPLLRYARDHGDLITVTYHDPS